MIWFIVWHILSYIFPWARCIICIIHSLYIVSSCVLPWSKCIICIIHSLYDISCPYVYYHEPDVVESWLWHSFLRRQACSSQTWNIWDFYISLYIILEIFDVINSQYFEHDFLGNICDLFLVGWSPNCPLLQPHLI